MVTRVESNNVANSGDSLAYAARLTHGLTRRGICMDGEPGGFGPGSEGEQAARLPVFRPGLVSLACAVRDRAGIRANRRVALGDRRSSSPGPDGKLSL
jgi:hypothetical protein